MISFKNLLRGRGLRKNPIVRWLLRTVRPGRIKAEGHWFYVDPDDAVVSAGLRKGIYEPVETAVMKRLVTEGMSVLDIGANIGYYSVLFSKWVGPKGTVHAFEPSPRTYELLRRNVHANASDNVTVHPAALSDTHGEVALYLNDYNGGDNRMYESSGLPSVIVPTRRLDDLLSPGTRVDFIKMDIQGAEYLALQGMQRVLAENKPLMVIEFSPLSIQRTSGSGSELLLMLSGLGYRFAEIHESDKSVQDISVDELLAAYPVTDERFTNILCTAPRDLPGLRKPSDILPAS